MILHRRDLIGLGAGEIGGWTRAVPANGNMEEEAWYAAYTMLLLGTNGKIASARMTGHAEAWKTAKEDVLLDYQVSLIRIRTADDGVTDFAAEFEIAFYRITLPVFITEQPEWVALTRQGIAALLQPFVDEVFGEKQIRVECKNIRSDQQGVAITITLSCAERCEALAFLKRFENFDDRLGVFLRDFKIAAEAFKRFFL